MRSSLQSVWYPAGGSRQRRCGGATSAAATPSRPSERVTGTVGRRTSAEATSVLTVRTTVRCRHDTVVVKNKPPERAFPQVNGWSGAGSNRRPSAFQGFYRPWDHDSVVIVLAQL